MGYAMQVMRGRVETPDGWGDVELTATRHWAVLAVGDVEIEFDPNLGSWSTWTTTGNMAADLAIPLDSGEVGSQYTAYVHPHGYVLMADCDAVCVFRAEIVDGGYLRLRVRDIRVWVA